MLLWQQVPYVGRHFCELQLSESSLIRTPKVMIFIDVLHVRMSDFLLYLAVLLYLFVDAKVHNDIDQDPESSHENDWI